ncbi:acetyl-CoA acetyltransferase [Pseudomonas chlororaphis]|uniref:acetyl-CoA acetyltransferase n=1 Tax=Pseudomonas chlororaphis TaxID=587753 RepID=UPI0006A5B5D1|nr:acetyl-CoA acetyltransferase [Pseudomonas chlororaphis]AZD02668.1 3-ketoacyl-CoA thiolase [Pseudomonas chlororaphis subsp. chlororaphis]MBM0280706.1 acetyl-CoA acetyltransferase [Pseudomonas chlororaphis]MDO1504653.1 acetyl-CoA acetyltransferase [Pseudomonas chlororaphis]ORM44593.1 acetyl-CoA acetyltransferase [Pseudomonas chlororaphis subsp. chlororaphis]TWR95786.1 thiolase domain-containing protein [Pseudomonas chlororaphis subsp. chlororaphis]
MIHDSVSIVAAAHSPFGRLDGLNLEDLIVQVTREALADAEIEAAQIDALFLGHFNSGLVADGFPASLMLQADPQLRFKPATRCENACASGSAAIQAGINAIRSGAAELVLVVGAEKMTGNSTVEVTRALAGAGYQNALQEAGMSFAQLFGRVAQQYADRYHSPLSSMAMIAVKNHANAMANPLAQMHRVMDFEHCNNVSQGNPLIAPPLRLTDCSLISDGAAAIILASPQRARSMRRQVAIRAMTQVNDFLPLSSRDMLAFEGPRRAIHGALRQAGVTLGDLSFAEVHDCFTIAELLIYEAMGLAPRGEGHRALDDGTVRQGGRLPVNLSGGLKAKGHPVGATGVSMHALGFAQLIGKPIGLGVPGAEFGLLFNMGGMAVANYASVLQAVKV